MVLSKTAGYAVRSIVYMAKQGSDKITVAKEIAEDERIPQHYAAKILQQLARLDYLKSYKGRGGGFKLAPETMNSSVYEVIERLRGDMKINSCLFDFNECTETTPCILCGKWQGISVQISDLLTEQKISDFT